MDPESLQTNVMKMERADGKDFEKSEDMQKWQNNGLRAMVIVPCFPRSQSIQPEKTGIIVFIRKKVLFSATSEETEEMLGEKIKNLGLRLHLCAGPIRPSRSSQ